MQGPRERMVVSAALLIRERGAHATAISDVLQHSGAPRGSAYHYFPGGRTQLLCEAVDYAGEHVAAMINEAEGGLELLDALIDKYRQQLLSTDFRAGCPIAAVSVEAGDEQDRERMAPVIARAAAVFDRWSDLTAQRFIADGIPPDRAHELAVLATSTLEGAILLARVRRDLTPLDLVHRQLRNLLLAELQSQPPAQEDAEDDSRPDAAEAAAAEPKSSAGPMFSTYGIASTLLGVLSVAAVVLGAMIWSAHRDDSGERTYLTRVMLTAAEWTAVLINMNADNIDASLQRLHDGTVGQLNTDFDAVVQPYRQVVEKLRTHSSGRIEAVAIDTVHRELDTQSGAARPVVTTKLPPFATRTDSVLLVATSVSENAGAKPQTVHWNLRLDVSDVDGKLMISRLESIR
ncbi:Conserved membrane protein of uncharacterised function [Mycobacterium tuberculosis]|nr:Conserved membrane protein of uncharacterised function [Mycobacterium tuberculosis]SGN45164.1 Conserved membrane protein of uncharacterised function [Mycobacterium tuberculosis]